MEFTQLVEEKLEQTYALLSQNNIDCYLVAGHSLFSPEPMLKYYILNREPEGRVIFLIFKNRKVKIFTREENYPALQSLGYKAESLLPLIDSDSLIISLLKEEGVSRLALNNASYLTYGSSLNFLLVGDLPESFKKYNIETVSAEDLAFCLATQKTRGERELIQKTSYEILNIFGEITHNLNPGWTFKTLISLVDEMVNQKLRNFSSGFKNRKFLEQGSKMMGLYDQGDPLIEPGQLLSFNLGLNYLNQEADFTRTWYVFKPGEESIPQKINEGFYQLQNHWLETAESIFPQMTFLSFIQDFLEKLTQEEKERTTLKLHDKSFKYFLDCKTKFEPLNVPTGYFDLNQVFTLELAMATHLGTLRQGETFILSENGVKTFLPKQKQIWTAQWFTDQQIRQVIE